MSPARRPSALVEELVAVEQAAACEPRPGAQFTHLHVGRVRIVQRVLGAVIPQPCAHVVRGVHPALPLSVDEELVLGHRYPPAWTYSARCASFSAACAAARRASGTRYGEQLT